jgi:uncharacterized membrane protein YeaQ/YmgE (transglycosylase-associated protein family)
MQPFAEEEKMNLTNIIIYLVVAAVIGWLASEIMRDRASILINIVVAVLGAFLAGYFLSPIFHVGTINEAINISTMLVTLLGAIIVIAIVHLLRHRV